MMLIYSCDAMKDEFLALYKKNFEIADGSKMETFLGMVVEQEEECIKIHLDNLNYVKEVIVEYSGYIKKSLRPKKVQMSPGPGVTVKAEDVSKLPYPTKLKHYSSFEATLHFAATWIRLDISLAV